MSKKSYRVKTKIKIEKDNIEQDKTNSVKSNVNLTKTLSREIKFTILMVFAICILLLAGSYSIFTATNKSDDYNSINIGTLKVDYLQKSEKVLNLNGTYPTMDTEGEKLEAYSFKITNNGTLQAAYKIKILNDNEIIEEDGCSNKLLPISDIKVKVNDSTPFILGDKESNSYVVEEGTILPNETKEYNIRIWLKDTAGNESLGKHYHGKVIVDSVNVSTN